MPSPFPDSRYAPTFSNQKIESAPLSAISNTHDKIGSQLEGSSVRESREIEQKSQRITRYKGIELLVLKASTLSISFGHLLDRRTFCKDPDLPSDMQDKHRYKLSKLPRNSSFARVRNRCIFTGRPRSVYEFFRISRIVFRGLASRGPLMGIKKSSW
ncbi:hypothetical protein NMG60_11019110 [Bertholletia excelsa]